MDNEHTNDEESQQNEQKNEEMSEGETIVLSDGDESVIDKSQAPNQNPYINENLDEDEEEDYIELPPLVPAFPFINSSESLINIEFDDNGVIVNSSIDQLWGLNYQYNLQISQEFIDAIPIVESSSISNNIMTAFFTNLENQFIQRDDLARLILTLERVKNNEDPIVFEIPKGTKDSILQLDDFCDNDIAYILDDCFTNFYMFETLEQIFTVQKSFLNPFSQQPIQRILKVKLNVI